MMAFNNNAITEADKRIAELEQQKRLLEQQNAQLVQEKTARENLLRGELTTEKNNKYEEDSGFSWDSLGKPPKDKSKTVSVTPDKLEEVVSHLVQRQFNTQLQNSAQKLQQEQQMQQQLIQKFQTEHPDLAGDPRVVDLIAQDWAEGKTLAGDRISAEALYARVVERGKKYKKLLPALPKPPHNNPYAPATPSSPFGVTGAGTQEIQDSKESHRAEIAARREALKKKMLGGIGTPTP